MDGYLNILRDYSLIDKEIKDLYRFDEETKVLVEEDFGQNPYEYPNKSVDEKEVMNYWNKDISSLVTIASSRIGSKRYIEKMSFIADRRLELLCHLFKTNPKVIVKIIKDKISRKFDYTDFTSKILSYMIGCVFGRWDITFCLARKPISTTPGPFEPVPLYQAGRLDLKNINENKSKNNYEEYPLEILSKGMVVDNDGHLFDIETKLREAFQLVWKEKASDIEAEICQILNIATFREYFRRQTLFFDDHYKRYSKSRRYAPIYWPLSTPSGSYTLWLYYHRIDDQMLFTCVNDFIDPKLKQIISDIYRIKSRHERTKEDENHLEELSDLEIELKEFRDELLRVAAFWKPNLNDGVEITASPLWRLFQHRSWQKRLKRTWERLEEGEYDWAHLAYSIWPKRVKQKCKTDKSIAIAHDLEHLYQGDD